MLGYLIAGLLDCLTIIPLTIVVLITMLQDRKRPLWPVWAIMAPLVLGLAWCIVSRSDDLLPVLYAYFLLMWVGLIIYMIRAIRQYRHWLRDNYADLEHKEVWQASVMLTIILLAYAFYSLDAGELLYEYAIEVIITVLVCYLLWRVESLSDLSISQQQSISTGLSVPSSFNNIGPLLQMHCIDTQLYLQHDLSLIQLAKAIGTNRTYLSLYFSNQNITYNAYINNLRINHFIRLYRKAVADQHFFTAQQLALESGYHSYRTFSEAFKRQTGQSVTVWMKTANKQEQSQTYLDSAERKLASPESKTENEG
jgi:AraC-like DNA-binding protein